MMSASKAYLRYELYVIGRKMAGIVLSRTKKPLMSIKGRVEIGVMKIAVCKFLAKRAPNIKPID